MTHTIPTSDAGRRLDRLIARVRRRQLDAAIRGQIDQSAHHARRAERLARLARRNRRAVGKSAAIACSE